MNRSFCLQTEMRHDERLMRMLSGYEFRHFFALLAFAAEGDDDTFIPARRLARLRYALRLPAKDFERRLVKFESDGLELIERTADGGIVIRFLTDQDDENEGEDSEDGSDTGAAPRRSGRALSMTPGAIRVRNLRERNGGGGNGNSPRSVTVTEDVTPAESKRNALPLQSGVTNGPGPALHPSRTRDVNVQRSPGFNSSEKNKSETLNVTEPPAVTPGVTVSAQGTGPGNGIGPPSRHSQAPVSGHARRLASQAIAVAVELKDLGSEAWHYQLFAIADEQGATHLLGEALESTRRRMVKRGMPQLGAPGAYYTSAVKRLFERHDPQIFVPTKADAEADTPEHVRAILQASLSGVTPLEDVYGDAPDTGLDPRDEDGGYTP